MPQSLAILADIGGTNTRVALARGAEVLAGSVRRYANAEFDGLEPILRRYLSEEDINGVDGACVAAAGPVQDGVAELTNLAWVIDAPLLTRATRARRTAIMNDLQAQGQALGHIAAQNLKPVIAGPQKPGAAMLVVGLGTGMNAAPVHNTPWGRVVAASECGHLSMPVRNEEDFRLSQFLAHGMPNAPGFAELENAIAGRGLEHIHRFVTAEAGATQALTAAEVMAALSEGQPMARKTAALYVHVVGQAIGDLALTHLPFGGIYLIGGVARAMSPYFAEFGLEASFKDKGRFQGFMESFSITLVEDDYAALTGCAVYLANGGKG